MKEKQKQDMNRIAEKFIRYFKNQDRKTSQGEDELWKLISAEIEKSETKPQSRKILHWVVSSTAIAASILLFLYIGNFFQTETSSELENYISSLSDDINKQNQIQLLLSDGERLSLEKDSVNILYYKNGTIKIDQQLRQQSRADAQNTEPEFDQIIVPKGKSIYVTLSDGSKMHVNSSTRVVYPRVFAETNREIYVDGEVFLDVTKNEKKPFLVRTSKFDVEVLGTAFNINAYNTEDQGEVVLARGSIRLIDKASHSMILKPNNLVSVKNGKAGEIEYVNAADYTAWTEGLLITHTETLAAVFKRLTRFYDVPITVAADVQPLVVNGKLDLRQSLPELLRLISVAAPINYQETNGGYIISLKKESNTN